MKQDYTHIEIVIDISGSMGGKENDVVGGINSLLEKQREGVRENGGVVKVNIRKFDTSLETIVENADVLTVKNLVVNDVRARGGTALFDAVGKTISSFGSYLASLNESDRPKGIVCVFYTDGEENSSKEYSLDKIKAQIKEQEDVYSWQFFFLGEGINGFTGGQNIGFNAMRSASFKDYKGAGDLIGSKIHSYTNVLRSGGGQLEASLLLDFNEQERNFLVK